MERKLKEYFQKVAGLLCAPSPSKGLGIVLWKIISVVKNMMFYKYKMNLFHSLFNSSRNHRNAKTGSKKFDRSNIYIDIDKNIGIWFLG